MVDQLEQSVKLKMRDKFKQLTEVALKETKEVFRGFWNKRFALFFNFSFICIDRDCIQDSVEILVWKYHQ